MRSPAIRKGACVAQACKGSVDVAGQTFQSSGDKDSVSLIVHLDAEGQVQWARHLHGPGTDYCLGVTTTHQDDKRLCTAFG